MKNNTFSMFVFVGLFAATAIMISGCAPQDLPPSAAPRTIEKLSILTPHNQQIRQAFELGFADWCRTKRDTDVQIDWVVMGTPQCIDYIDRVVRGISDDRKKQLPDLMFGGGVLDHDLLAQRGYTRRLHIDDAVGDTPAEIYGLPTRDPEGRWYATGLSSFGIVYNKAACTERGIAPPTSWSDLAAPRFRGWLGVADPGASGSHRQAMMFILQDQGWDQGWSTIIRTLANARALAAGSKESLDLVERGVFLAAFSVNFDGMKRADQSGGSVVYFNPPGATAATPDIVSALKSPSDPKLSEEFVRYCLSEAGQVAWGVEAKHTAGSSMTLYHYPIDPDVYAKYAGEMAVKENPFEVNLGLKIDLATAGKQNAVLVPLVEAACADHILLQQAWQAVIEAGMKADALQALTSPPLEKNVAYKAIEKLRTATTEEQQQMRNEWAEMFKKRYQKVIAMCAS